MSERNGRPKGIHCQADGRCALGCGVVAACHVPSSPGFTSDRQMDERRQISFADREFHDLQMRPCVRVHRADTGLHHQRDCRVHIRKIERQQRLTRQCRHSRQTPAGCARVPHMRHVMGLEPLLVLVHPFERGTPGIHLTGEAFPSRRPQHLGTQAPPCSVAVLACGGVPGHHAADDRGVHVRCVSQRGLQTGHMIRVVEPQQR